MWCSSWTGVLCEVLPNKRKFKMGQKTLIAAGIALGMAAIDIVALGLVKQVSQRHFTPLLILVSIVLYALQPLIFYAALRMQGLAVVNLLWNVLSSILVTTVALLYFREKLTPIKLVGVVFSILAIALLAIGDDV